MFNSSNFSGSLEDYINLASNIYFNEIPENDISNYKFIGYDSTNKEFNRICNFLYNAELKNSKKLYENESSYSRQISDLLKKYYEKELTFSDLKSLLSLIIKFNEKAKEYFIDNADINVFGLEKDLLKNSNYLFRIIVDLIKNFFSLNSFSLIYKEDESSEAKELKFNDTDINIIVFDIFLKILNNNVEEFIKSFLDDQDKLKCFPGLFPTEITPLNFSRSFFSNPSLKYDVEYSVNIDEVNGVLLVSLYYTKNTKDGADRFEITTFRYKKEGNTYVEKGNSFFGSLVSITERGSVVSVQYPWLNSEDDTATEIFINAITIPDNEKLESEIKNNFIEDIEELVVARILKEFFIAYPNTKSNIKNKKSANQIEVSSSEANNQLTFFDIINFRMTQKEFEEIQNLFENVAVERINEPTIFIDDEIGFSICILSKELNPYLRQVGFVDLTELIFSLMFIKKRFSEIFDPLNIVNKNTFKESIQDDFKRFRNDSLLLDINEDGFFKYIYFNQYKARTETNNSLIFYTYGNNENLNYAYGSKDVDALRIEKFIDIFQNSRDVYYTRFLNKSFINEENYDLYEKLSISFTALVRFFTSKNDLVHDTDYFNEDDVKNFLISYGLKPLTELQTFVGEYENQLKIVKNYNELVRNKGSKKVIELLMRVFEASETEIDINKYVLVKDYESNVYKFIEIPYSDSNELYKLINSLSKGEDYETFIESDPYWRDISTSDLDSLGVNTVETKYNSLNIKENISNSFILTRYVLSAILAIKKLFPEYFFKEDENYYGPILQTVLLSINSLEQEVSIVDVIELLAYMATLNNLINKLSNSTSSGHIFDNDFLISKRNYENNSSLFIGENYITGFNGDLSEIKLILKSEDGNQLKLYIKTPASESQTSQTFDITQYFRIKEITEQEYEVFSIRERDTVESGLKMSLSTDISVDDNNWSGSNIRAIKNFYGVNDMAFNGENLKNLIRNLFGDSTVSGLQKVSSPSNAETISNGYFFNTLKSEDATKIFSFNSEEEGLTKSGENVLSLAKESPNMGNGNDSSKSIYNYLFSLNFLSDIEITIKKDANYTGYTGKVFENLSEADVARYIFLISYLYTNGFITDTNSINNLKMLTIKNSLSADDFFSAVINNIIKLPIDFFNNGCFALSSLENKNESFFELVNILLKDEYTLSYDILERYSLPDNEILKKNFSAIFSENSSVRRVFSFNGEGKVIGIGDASAANLESAKMSIFEIIVSLINSFRNFFNLQENSQINIYLPENEVNLAKFLKAAIEFFISYTTNLYKTRVITSINSKSESFFIRDRVKVSKESSTIFSDTYIIDEELQYEENDVLNLKDKLVITKNNI